MAKVIVTEYQSEGVIGPDRNVQAGHQPSLATQVVTIGGTSAAITNPFNAATALVRVKAEADCWVKFGGTPTAAADECEALSANETEWFDVTPGSGLKLACIERTVS